MHYLGLDIGKKRIGVAISESGIIAQEYKTIVVVNDKQVIKEIADICQKENIEKIVVGLPINMNDTESDFTKEVRDFSQKMKANIKIPIIFEDERLTSIEAERLLRENNIEKKELKKRIDQFSAKLILEQHFEKI